MGIRMWVLAVVCGWGIALAAIAQTEEPKSADVRLLVDISGSMKQTDPKNLRVPALELMVNLLPDQSHAGVWSFGQQVNMLVPFAQVDDAWRDRARRNTAKINSVGLYTNIGAALEKATALAPQNGNASLVLLTDGKVDIDKNASLNRRERQRILSELLPDLKSKGFTLHTIALSEDADTQLLQQLSRDTDGVYSVAKSADELMQSYLLMFDQAVPAKRLPLTGNQFKVDDSVDEFTALIFRQPDSEPTQLIAPNGDRYSASAYPKSVSWYGADSYDLMTVSNPMAGQWQVLADETPQNRVTVVSDLELRVNALPNNLVAGDELELQFGLYEQGEVITDPDFLGLLTAHAEISPVAKPGRWQVSLATDRLPADGIFRKNIPKFKQRGDFDISVVVDGKTFEREFKHRVKVGSLFQVQMRKRIDGNKVHYDIVAAGDQDLIQTELSAVVAHIKVSEGDNELEPMQQTEIGRWELTVSPTQPARYVIELQASGEDVDGQAFDEVLPSLYFSYPAEGDPVETEADKELEALEALLAEEQAALAQEKREPEPSLESEPETEPEAPVQKPATATQEAVQPEPPVEQPNDEPVPEETEGLNWLMISAIVGGNLLLFGVIYFAYRQFSTKGVQSELDEFEQALQQGSATQSADTAPATAEMPAMVGDDDPLAALDALTDSAPSEGDMFPVDEAGKTKSGEDLPMDDLGTDDDNK
ncbi:VWA domain-containing protein [Gilvimarinus sp. SDUM040013]|uniref:VWA domain-containing protein n=1 Tax=Gilvimarinus gilvus TaxID=3058038 RepID=A0ABU4RVC3_9GAMM|nr:VWA domain-containing protein [Gilvimarinus sp. SDUM040013]MDO3386950.1 VWA domain-containing protein [Gilvimarinus sp. SDUM040013]MDX6848156.1 VWA domain-containing protein [Gilvimarinus sp. SDUM040013]